MRGLLAGGAGVGGVVRRVGGGRGGARGLLVALQPAQRTLFVTTGLRDETSKGKTDKAPTGAGAGGLVRGLPYSSLAIGVPKETMPSERRVAQTPATVAQLVNSGFKVRRHVMGRVGGGFRLLEGSWEFVVCLSLSLFLSLSLSLSLISFTSLSSLTWGTHGRWRWRRGQGRCRASATASMSRPARAPPSPPQRRSDPSHPLLSLSPSPSSPPQRRSDPSHPLPSLSPFPLLALWWLFVG